MLVAFRIISIIFIIKVIIASVTGKPVHNFDLNLPATGQEAEQAVTSAAQQVESQLSDSLGQVISATHDTLMSSVAGSSTGSRSHLEEQSDPVNILRNAFAKSYTSQHRRGNPYEEFEEQQLLRSLVHEALAPLHASPQESYWTVRLPEDVPPRSERRKSIMSIAHKARKRPGNQVLNLKNLTPDGGDIEVYASLLRPQSARSYANDANTISSIYMITYRVKKANGSTVMDLPLGLLKLRRRHLRRIGEPLEVRFHSSPQK